MPTLNICSTCGAEIQMDAPSGQCTLCLFTHALTPDHHYRPEGWLGQIDDYELLEEIARGGMGVVYKARQISIKRLVALKMMLGGVFASETAKARFMVESEAVASLDHPNIVPLLAIGEHDKQPYYVMKLVQGKNLMERLIEEKMTPMHAVKIISILAEALDYAHEKGVLHRDIKPSNILIDQFGKPYLTDFGLAKLLGREGDLTRTVAVFGTPAYLSPEQASGHTKFVTASTDIYSLGAVLYELLTHKPPFQDESPFAVLQKVIHEDPLSPHELNPLIELSLSTICMTCLAKDPKARYGSAGQLARDLYRYSISQQVSVSAPGIFTKVLKKFQLYPRTAFCTLVFVLATLFGLIGFLAGRYF